MLDYEMIAAHEVIGQNINALADFQASHISIYLMIIFAYLAVAYFAGKKLTRFQLAIVTFLFMAASAREVDVPGDSIWLPNTLWSTGSVASLVFMWSMRRSKTE
jgi:hypothetical protein